MAGFPQAALIAGSAAILAAAPAAAQEVRTASLETGQDLSALSIEELAQLPVRSASKVEEPLSRAPTALFVLTGAVSALAGMWWSSLSAATIVTNDAPLLLTTSAAELHRFFLSTLAQLEEVIAERRSPVVGGGAHRELGAWSLLAQPGEHAVAELGLGSGTAWFSSAEARGRVRELLGLPSHLEPWSAIGLGHTDTSQAQAAPQLSGRKPLEEIASWGRYGEPRP